MKLYVLRTTFPGADAPTEFYFNTKSAAENFEHSDCYEIEGTELNITEFPGNGCTWNDIDLANFNWWE